MAKAWTSKKTKEYWEDRAREAIEQGVKTQEELIDELESVYKQLYKDIIQEIEAFYGKYSTRTGLTLEDVRKRLTADELKAFAEAAVEYNEALKELGNVAEFQEYLRELSAKAYMSRLETLKLNVRYHIEETFHTQLDMFGNELNGFYSDTYLRAAYDFQIFSGRANTFAMPNNKVINQIVSERWVGTNFSDSIWLDKEKLVNTLNDTMSRGFAAGKNPKEIARDIQKGTDSSYSNAKRLARTEFMHAANQATLDSYKANGVTEYQFLAGLDETTCKICGGLDGQVFPTIKAIEGENFPVMHPNCHCTTVPYFEPDEIDAMFDEGTRIARDTEGKSYYVPASLTYSKWKAGLVDVGDGNMRYVG